MDQALEAAPSYLVKQALPVVQNLALAGNQALPSYLETQALPGNQTLHWPLAVRRRQQAQAGALREGIRSNTNVNVRA